jgi:hypothetical protein
MNLKWILVFFIIVPTWVPWIHPRLLTMGKLTRLWESAFHLLFLFFFSSFHLVGWWFHFAKYLNGYLVGFYSLSTTLVVIKNCYWNRFFFKNPNFNALLAQLDIWALRCTSLVASIWECSVWNNKVSVNSLLEKDKTKCVNSLLEKDKTKCPTLLDTLSPFPIIPKP